MKAHYLALITVALFHVPTVSAQVRRSAALDAGIGIANGRGGDFVDRGFAGARIAVSGVVPVTQNVGLFIGLGYDWSGRPPAHGDLCRIDPGNPGGGCLPSFPAIRGADLTVGGAAALGSTVELRAGLGAGAFSLDGTRLGGVLGEGEVAFFPVASFGIVASTRTLVIPSYRGDRLSLARWSLGLRLRRSVSHSQRR